MKKHASFIPQITKKFHEIVSFGNICRLYSSYYLTRILSLFRSPYRNTSHSLARATYGAEPACVVIIANICYAHSNYPPREKRTVHFPRVRYVTLLTDKKGEKSDTRFMLIYNVYRADHYQSNFNHKRQKWIRMSPSGQQFRSRCFVVSTEPLDFHTYRARYMLPMRYAVQEEGVD